MKRLKHNFNNRKQVSFAQATVEYIILFVVIASVTGIGVSRYWPRLLKYAEAYFITRSTMVGLGGEIIDIVLD